jgi:tetratricopeptide (TPR) repeat protein
LIVSMLGVGLASGADVTLLAMAKRGNADAQFALAQAYLDGREVPKNADEAVKWLWMAVRQDHLEARYVLGTMYRRGSGVARDYKRAATLLGKAALKGHAEAQLAVGEMFMAGHGGPRNYKAAVDWLQSAAAKGLARAQAWLGELYYDGRGRPASHAQAYFWLTLADDAVSPRGRELLESLNQELAQPQRQKIVRRARAYSAEHPRPTKKPSPLKGIPVIAKAGAPTSETSDQPEEEAVLSQADLASLREAKALLDAGIRDEDGARVAEGRRIADEILGRDPSNPQARFLRARADIAEGRLQTATRDLRAAIDQMPEWAEARLLLASALERQGELEEARGELTRSLRLDSAMIEARSALARVEAARGDHESAVMHGRLYLEERPASSEMRGLVVESLVALGRAEDALRLLLAIPERDRDADVISSLGQVYAALGQPKKARGLLARADVEAPHQAGTLRGLLALDAAEDRLQESVERIEAALEIRPNDAVLHRLRGLAARRGGDDQEAEPSFLRAIELDPRDIESYTQLAELYLEAGRTQEAVGIYERSVKTLPSASAGQMHFPLAGAYLSLGQRDRAIESYEAAIRYAPAHAQAKLALADLLAEGEQQDLGRAISLAEEARRLAANDPRSVVVLGKLYLKRGSPEDAIRFLEGAESSIPPGDPSLGEFRYRLALAYEANGDLELASAEFERALSELDTGTATSEGESSWVADTRTRLARLKSRR